jgi:hypothetical protein
MMRTSFDEVVAFDDLVRTIRRRYQMWFGDDIGQLKGFLAGFCSARPSVDHSRLLEFEEFVLTRCVKSGREVRNWVAAVRYAAPHVFSEIPLFFDWYEQFIEKFSHEIWRFELSETERANFAEQDVLQFRSLAIPTPNSLSLRQSEFWGAMVHFYDPSGRKCYELGVASVEYGTELIAKYRGISR